MKGTHLNQQLLDETYASQPWCPGRCRSIGVVVFSVTAVAGGVIILLAVFEVIGHTGSVGYCVAVVGGATEILFSVTMIIGCAVAVCQRRPPKKLEHKTRVYLTLDSFLDALHKEGKALEAPTAIHFDVNSTDHQYDRGQTALHMAAEFGNGPVVRFLIDQGANTKLRDGANKTPLHIFCSDFHGDTRALDAL